MIRFRKNGSRNSIRSYSIHYLWIFIYLNVCREAQGTLFPAGQYRIRDFSKVSDAGKAGKWKHRLLWKESTSCHESFVFRDKSPLFFRGGYNSNVTSTSNDDANSNTSTSTTSAEQDEEIRPESTPENCETDIKLEMTGKQCGKRTQMRHTSDMLRNLIERSAVVVQESVSLRDLIYQRSQDYLADLKTKETKAIDTGKIQKFPHPKKVLHYLAPKIPAIKHSPDVNLRIHTARFDIDSGIAACLIGTVAQVCEKYDNSILLQNRLQEKEDNGNTDDPISAANDLVNDRRFEQLIECLVCGVNVKQRKLEHMSMELKWSDAALKETNDKDDIHDLMEGNQLQVREGLNIRDACRAAWGLAILGAHHRESLGGVHIMDLLLALSLRVRELLLSRVQIFFQGDLMEEITSLTAEGKKAGFSQQAPQQHLNDLAEELAEDSAAAMWAFACVRACTGLRSDPLFETCCSILCRNPADLRKQALEREDAEPTVVINDVVDRLAYSESQIEGEHPAAEANKTNSNKEGWTETGTIAGKLTGSDEKEALIDWLSPNELTDVLWALALHGHSNETTRGENLLSENGNALKDIAFDRLIVLLREDFLVLETQRKKEVKREKDAEDNLAHSTAKYVTNEGETMTVEVVDAAALLASENASKATFVTPVENMTTRAALSANGDGGLLISGVEEAEFVDAATIIRSSGEEIEQRETMAAAQEVVIDADGEQTAHMNDIFSDDQDSVVSTLSERQIVADKTVEDNEELSDTPDAETWTTTAELLYFSPHDLCSLAWAVTELRDSLRFQTVHLVINIFSRLGEESFDTLGGADLSNLAWAMARQLNDARPWTSEASNPSTLQLMLWIVRRALVASGGSDAALNSHNIHILDPFQPPELSRLMWAVATGMRIFADESKVHFPDVEDLAINALLAASSNLSLFSPEDLVRIFWAFLELCDMDEALSYPHAAVAVGRVFSFIESFILRWEQGMCAPKEEELEDGDKGGGFSGITAFFLRPRLSRHMLDQIIEEYDDVEEEDDRILQLLDFKKSRRLPRLRDLAVDPSSLAKAAGGFAKLSVKHPNIRGSSTLTRVILKLLSSKNGRLLQEFSVGNLIRACEAAAINFSVDRSLDPVVGQFVRRFLHLLNDSNDPQNSNSGNFRKDLKLSSMSPPEISKLLWSLGELGARHLRTDKDSASAHRKLRFVMDGAMLTDDQLDHLSSSATMKVVCTMYLCFLLFFFNLPILSRSYFCPVSEAAWSSSHE